MTKTVLIGGVVKTVLMGGAGGAVYLTNILDIPDDLTTKSYALKTTSLPETISALNDIELYERYYGCSFVFVKSWGNKEIYNYSEFLKQHRDTPNQWSNLVIKSADSFKNDCKQKKIITLSFLQRGNKFTYLVPST
ncbi:hypothetical protein A6V39_04130 [Candidatus Mycoplasma haematobovis]|uniref:Uncharacterized protein n=1 Tax=Candidatus Mycoplasma haematobovis TaxID=432608 RepID=A0A1A9QC84_9MOLU|nr:hypothetical protein [Candidatus Mycoplasma haematobovis]OAL10077.1 hypothetical protein A6V39_04130 [Candidatus Mycoplasma haematobovis]